MAPHIEFLQHNKSPQFSFEMLHIISHVRDNSIALNAAAAFTCSIFVKAIGHHWVIYNNIINYFIIAHVLSDHNYLLVIQQGEITVADQTSASTRPFVFRHHRRDCRSQTFPLLMPTLCHDIWITNTGLTRGALVPRYDLSCNSVIRRNKWTHTWCSLTWTDNRRRSTSRPVYIALAL